MAEISIAYHNGMVVAKPLSEDDEDDGPGRILTVEEFLDRLRNRSDIFGVDKNSRLKNIEIVTLLCALLVAFFAAQVKPVKITPEFYEKNPNVAVPPMTLTDIEVRRPGSLQKPVPKPPVARVNDRHPLRQPNRSEVNQSTAEGTGGGDIRGRVVKQGVLGILAGKITGRDALDGDILGQGGFAEGVDAILSGVQGLKRGGTSVASRPGVNAIGFGPGYNSGYNGTGPGSIDGMIDDLMKPVGSEVPIALKTGPPDRIRNASITPVSRGVALTGEGRSKSDIMRVVLQNLSALRYAYNQRLRDRPGLTGKITIKFAVDEFGNVIACEVVGSSVADSELEAVVRGKILRWRFDRINKPGDITEVVYPFVFST